MKISAKARNGLKVMAELAKYYDSEDILSTNQLAKTTIISEKYLEQILNTLKKSGLVEAFRGNQGGYRLSRKPQDITIGDIVRCLEDDLKFVDCLNNKCKNQQRCKSYDIWVKLYDEINNFLDSITISSMVEKEEIE